MTSFPLQKMKINVILISGVWKMMQYNSYQQQQKVPVLLTDRTASSIDMLTPHRSQVGVPKENPLCQTVVQHTHQGI